MLGQHWRLTEPGQQHAHFSTTYISSARNIMPVPVQRSLTPAHTIMYKLRSFRSLGSIKEQFQYVCYQGIPAFLPIPLRSLQLGLLKDRDWLRELSWDQSWHNLIGYPSSQRNPLVSQHYISPTEMFEMWKEFEKKKTE